MAHCYSLNYTVTYLGNILNLCPMSPLNTRVVTTGSIAAIYTVTYLGNILNLCPMSPLNTRVVTTGTMAAIYTVIYLGNILNLCPMSPLNTRVVTTGTIAAIAKSAENSSCKGLFPINHSTYIFFCTGWSKKKFMMWSKGKVLKKSKNIFWWSLSLYIFTSFQEVRAF